MKYFSEDTQYINAECESCGRVLKIPRERCGMTADRFTVTPAVMCQCGVSSNNISSVSSSHSSQTHAGSKQCPNCGGYKTETTKTENLSVKKLKSSDERKKEISDSLKTFLAFVLLTSPCTFIGIQSGITDDASLITIWILIIILFFFVINAIFRKTKDVPIGKIYYYYCRLCGYRWLWKTGTSLPKVNVRPDLISAGEQRLHDEEEQRKRAIAYDILNRKD